MNVNELKRVVPRALWPYLGDARRWVRTIPLRPQLHKRRLLSDASLSLAERELLGKVSGKIYYRDRMYARAGSYPQITQISQIQ